MDFDENARVGARSENSGQCDRSRPDLAERPTEPGAIRTPMCADALTARNEPGRDMCRSPFHPCGACHDGANDRIGWRATSRLGAPADTVFSRMRVRNVSFLHFGQNRRFSRKHCAQLGFSLPKRRRESGLWLLCDGFSPDLTKITIIIQKHRKTAWKLGNGFEVPVSLAANRRVAQFSTGLSPEVVDYRMTSGDTAEIRDAFAMNPAFGDQDRVSWCPALE